MSGAAEKQKEVIATIATDKRLDKVALREFNCTETQPSVAAGPARSFCNKQTKPGGKMKSLLIASIVLANASSAFTQGTVIFNLRMSGTSHVYAPHTPDLGQVGQGSNDGVPSGTTDWSGWTAIGANGLTGQYGAQSTFISILGGPGSN